MRKKGSGLVLAVSFIAIGITLLLFYLYAVKGSIGKIQYTLKEEYAQVKADQFMVAYLQTPTDEGTISDLIVLYDNAGSKDLLEKETGKIITSAFGSKAKWRIDVGEKTISNYIIPTGDKQVSRIVLPSFEPGEKTEVRLFLYT